MWINIQRENFSNKEAQSVIIRGIGKGKIIATDTRDWKCSTFGTISKSPKSYTVKMTGGKIRHGIRAKELILN